MSVFIRGIGTISPQQTHDAGVFTEGLMPLHKIRNMCIEPDYTKFVDPKQIRRMSRIIRMGVASSMLAMRESGMEKPEAIIVGTAFGCLEDTNSFLSKLVQYREDMLSPTAFIHSTHNTIAAQVALLFQCRGYNSTYVHKRLSFESALMDGMLLLDEGSAEQVLVGGVDEIIDAEMTIMQRLAHFKKEEEVSGGDFISVKTKGTVAGEGSTFFSLTTKKAEKCYAQIKAVKTKSFVTVENFVDETKELLETNNISLPDLVLAGYNGDIEEDALTDTYISSLALNKITSPYKNYCGEYGTSTAFALWMAANILKEETIPVKFKLKTEKTTGIKNILIYNHLGNNHHSLILVSSC